MRQQFDFKKLKSERLRYGMTFYSLAQALQKFELKASPQLTWQWEKKKKVPTTKYITALCEIFDQNPDFFFS